MGFNSGFKGLKFWTSERTSKHSVLELDEQLCYFDYAERSEKMIMRSWL
jgi:hypothetical protein